LHSLLRPVCYSLDHDRVCSPAGHGRAACSHAAHGDAPAPDAAGVVGDRASPSHGLDAVAAADSVMDVDDSRSAADVADWEVVCWCLHRQAQPVYPGQMLVTSCWVGVCYPLTL